MARGPMQLHRLKAGPAYYCCEKVYTKISPNAVERYERTKIKQPYMNVLSCQIKRRK